MTKAKLNRAEVGPRIVNAASVPMGTIGILSGNMYAGRLVMRTYGGMVSLQEDIGTTWDEVATKCHDIELLPAGSTVTLTVG
jgi:hypothetical protein